MRKPSKRNTAESELPCAKWRFETIHVLKGALILDVNFKFLGVWFCTYGNWKITMKGDWEALLNSGERFPTSKSFITIWNRAV